MEYPKYSLLLKWSEADNGYVVLWPEWEGRTNMPFTDGPTWVEAAKKAQDAMEFLVEASREDGEALPEPDFWKYEED